MDRSYRLIRLCRRHFLHIVPEIVPRWYVVFAGQNSRRNRTALNPLRASANRLIACGLALRPWLGRTRLPAAGVDESERVSPAERQPCRTVDAKFTEARVQGRERRRA